MTLLPPFSLVQRYRLTLALFVLVDHAVWFWGGHLEQVALF